MSATIALVVNQFPATSEPFIVNKVVGLLALGLDVRIVAKRTRQAEWGAFPQIADTDGIRSRLHVSPHPEQALLDLAPDLVHFEFMSLARRRIGLMKLALGCRTIVSSRGSDLKVFGLDDPTCYEDVWVHADALHLVARHLWEAAQRRGCPASKDHFVISSAVDTTFFSCTERRVAENIGSPDHPLRLLSVGRLHWVKGFEYAIAALRTLRDRGTHAVLRIIGGGEHGDALALAAADAGVEDSVELLGSQPRGVVRDQMLWADVYIQPSLSEGYCNAVIEAQSMGLPVVSSDAAGLLEYAEGRDTVFVVPRRDAGGLANVLGHLASEADVRRKAGSAAAERVRQEFGVNNQIEGFAAMYQQVLRGPDTHDSTSDSQLRELVRELQRDVWDLQSRVRTEAELSKERSLQLRETRSQLRRVKADLVATRRGSRELTAEVRAFRRRERELSRVDELIDRAVDRLRDAVGETMSLEKVAEHHSHMSSPLLVELVTPPGSVVYCVSKGDDDLISFTDRVGRHFPEDPSGGYAGFHPADSEHAVRLLQSAIEHGAEFLVVPEPSRWWFTHYAGFAQHLATFSVLVSTAACEIIDLRTRASVAPRGQYRTEVSPTPVGRLMRWFSARRPQADSGIAHTQGREK